MICIHEDILRQLGMSSRKIELLALGFTAHGILPSAQFHFAAAGGRRPMGLSAADWLSTERPPRLLLVGMRDGFEAGGKIARQEVLSICVAEDGRSPALLTEHDRGTLPDVMRRYGRESQIGLERALREFFSWDPQRPG
jgi:hypothetical protein